MRRNCGKINAATGRKRETFPFTGRGEVTLCILRGGIIFIELHFKKKKKKATLCNGCW